MKLIYCTKCKDIRLLRKDSVTCFCGESGGHYKDDGLNAEICGKAIPIGISNTSFKISLSCWLSGGSRSVPFEAFIIEKDCKTIDYKEKK